MQGGFMQSDACKRSHPPGQAEIAGSSKIHRSIGIIAVRWKSVIIQS